MDALVQLEDVTRSYRMGRSSFEALRGVSLRVERGEYLAVIGPSGSVEVPAVAVPLPKRSAWKYRCSPEETSICAIG